MPFASSGARGRRRERGEPTQPANWKIVAENYLEGYHVPIAHPGLMRLYDYKSYSSSSTMAGPGSTRRLRDEPSAQPARAPLPAPRAADARALEADEPVWRYAFVYPNTAIDLYPDQVNVWQILPAGAEGDRGRLGMLPPPRARAR